MSGILLGVLISSLFTQPLDFGFDYSPVEQVSTQTIHHSGFSYDDPRQAIIQKAYDLGGLDFVTMIECENGNWQPERVSKTNDHGICQLNYKYNKAFINSEEFKDVYKQLDYCYAKWKVNPKLWYGPSRKIKGQKCKDYVLNRFIIEGNERKT